jgi:prepilin-type N-terminal cleavage/methylation domain-containing protein
MPGKRLAQAGMTLIELLIAVAIGAIVLAALNSVVSLGLQAQAAGRQQNELVFQARFALERMVTTARGVSPSVVIAATPTVSTTCGGIGTPVAVAGGSTVTLPAGRSIPANGSCTLTVNVTAAVGGSYIASLPAGALVTSNGNNAAPAVATLTVVPPGPTLPTPGEVFSPASINAGGSSTLTVTLSNPNVSVATLTAALIDTLPIGVVIASTPNLSTTCGGFGAPVAVAGRSTVTLPAGRSILANGNCTLTVNVKAAVGGSYINALLADALVTSNGNNAAPAVATLTVIPLGPTLPTLANAFSPASINAGDVSTLTVTFSNPNGSVATLTTPLIYTLPSVGGAGPGRVVIAAMPTTDTTGSWFSPVMYCWNSINRELVETIPADNGCTTRTKVIASSVTNFSAQLVPPSRVSPVERDRPAVTFSVKVETSTVPQPVQLSTSVRLGGGAL